MSVVVFQETKFVDPEMQSSHDVHLSQNKIPSPPPNYIWEGITLKKKNVSTYLHLQSKLLTFSQSIGQCGVDTWPHLPVCLWSGHFSGSVSSSLKWGHGKDVWPGWLGCLSVNRLWSGWPESTSAQSGPVLSTLAVTVEARCPLQRSPGTFSASG